MQALYFALAGLHMVAIVITGILWTVFDLGAKEKLRPHLRDIRAVHFGSLYLVPWFFGLAYAFEKLNVPARHQIVFPVGLGALVFSPAWLICSHFKRVWTPSITGPKERR